MSLDKDLLSQLKLLLTMAQSKSFKNRFKTQRHSPNPPTEMSTKIQLKTKGYQTWSKTTRVKIKNSVKKFKNFNKSSLRLIQFHLPKRQVLELIQVLHLKILRIEGWLTQISKETDFPQQIPVLKLAMWLHQSTVRWPGIANENMFIRIY